MRCTVFDRVASAYLDRDALCLWKISSDLSRLIIYPFCSFPLIFTRHQVCFLSDKTVGNGKAVLPKKFTSRRYQPNVSIFNLTMYGPFFISFCGNFQKSRKNRFMAGILGNTSLKNSQERSWILKRRDFARSTHFVRRNQRQHRET